MNQKNAAAEKSERLEHTPGPWRGTEFGTIRAGVIGDEVTIASQIKTQSNVDLIAAAPELLEALKRFVASSRSTCAAKDTPMRCGIDRAPCVSCHAKVVIAKAEGR